MKEKWIMTMVSTQLDEGAAEERTELDSEITYAADHPGEYVITYKESMQQGYGSDSHVEIRVTAQSHISILRTGPCQTLLHIEPGKCHFTQYELPFGTIALNVIGKYIHNTLTSEGGHLDFRYAVGGETGMVSDTKISLDIVKKIV